MISLRRNLPGNAESHVDEVTNATFRIGNGGEGGTQNRHLISPEERRIQIHFVGQKA